MPKPYRIDDDLEVELSERRDVWSPVSAGYFINQTRQHSDEINYEGATFIDVGAGSGVLAIAALKLGAKFGLMLDNNPSAVSLAGFNSKQNGYLKDRALSIQSNVFSGVPLGFKADIAMGNLPHNPYMPHVHDDDPAAKSNQNGSGREVVDEFIRNVKNYLTEKGIAVFTTSSRQGFYRTTNLLNINFGKENWSVINNTNGQDGIEEQLDRDYHMPFLYHWLGQSKIDNQFRVYQKDINGNPAVFVDMYDNGEIFFMGSINDPNNNGKLTLVQVTKNGEIHFDQIYPDGSKRSRPDLKDESLIPEIPDKSKWYHRYYIILAKNCPTPES